eukprot:4317956-Prymnesium_polylepis.2
MVRAGRCDRCGLRRLGNGGGSSRSQVCRAGQARRHGVGGGFGGVGDNRPLRLGDEEVAPRFAVEGHGRPHVVRRVIGCGLERVGETEAQRHPPAGGRGGDLEGHGAARLVLRHRVDLRDEVRARDRHPRE